MPLIQTLQAIVRVATKSRVVVFSPVGGKGTAVWKVATAAGAAAAAATPKGRKVLDRGLGLAFSALAFIGKTGGESLEQRQQKKANRKKRFFADDEE